MPVNLSYEDAEDIIITVSNNDARSISSSRTKYRTTPLLYINGSKLPIHLAKLARPNQTLLDYLRNTLKLTGSKLGCGEGGCGACTVLLSRFVRGKKKIVHSTVNACLFPVLAADGCHVTTVEGVGSWRYNKSDSAAAASNVGGSVQSTDHLHPVQRAMVDMHGSQCGYCTPGIIMAIYGLFAQDGMQPSPATAASGGDDDKKTMMQRHEYLEEHLDGNLCRCTGYRPIWDAARSLLSCHHHKSNTNDDDEDLEDFFSNNSDDAMNRGPCGVLCGECPERDNCEMDCNLETKAAAASSSSSSAGDNNANENESIGCNNDGSTSSVKSKCCSSSTAQKIKQYQEVIESKHSREWWDQPNHMFPKELLFLAKDGANDDDDGGCDSDGSVHNELSKPLKVVDTSIHNGGTWYKANTLEELLDLFREYSGDNRSGGGIKIIVGNTEVGIETKFKHASYLNMVHPSKDIHTLHEIFATDDYFHVGGCSALSDLQQFCHNEMKGEGRRRRQRTAQPIHDMLRWFASTQIRNVACLAGNLVTASPISDMNPILCSLGATLVLASRPRSDGGIVRRKVNTSDFFVGYRTVEKDDMEVIERVDIPLLQDRFEYCLPFKQARRREDDISIVTSGMRIKLRPAVSISDSGSGHWEIEDIAISFGGMAPKTVMAHKTSNTLIGKPFNLSSFDEARKVLQDEFQMPEDVPGGQAQYRLTLACSFLHRFYLSCVEELRKEVAAIYATGENNASYPPAPSIDDEEVCGVGGFVGVKKPRIKGIQTYPMPKVAAGLEVKHLGMKNQSNALPRVTTAATSKSPDNEQAKDKNSVGQPTTHASGPLHCTGEAIYTDDIPSPANLLHGSLILASKCHAILASINAEPALSIPGVAGVFTSDDIEKLGGDNKMGPILLDDVAFVPVGEKIGFVGQVLGIVVAVTQDIAEKGARAVAVEYTDEKDGKAIVSIEEAIKSESYWSDFRHEIKRGGNVDDILKEANVDGKRLVVVEGSMRSGGQEHFYLEPNSTLAVPSESATNLTIYASTQAPTKTQDFCARVTNTPAAKVVVRMKRMGGGFGGKETRSVFCSVAAAVAAKLLNQPVRVTLNRDTDMAITGGRHAFLAYYKAGAIVEEDGTVKLHAIDVQLYNNGGSKFDLTGPVMDRALFHVDSCYFWPNFRSVGTPCKTSQPPHTAFRGFGGPQGLLVAEHVLDHLAIECNVSGDKLRRDNMYTSQDATPFGMRFGDGFTGKWNVPGMWDRLEKELDIPGRRKRAAEFNKKNKWVKRGIGFIPTKFGIAFTAKYMNQGGALVHLYTDGTVLVTHGGTEMGQGLHTKVIQVAAQAFNIPLDHVYVDDSSTDKVANTIPSAASMSTDLYGMATLDACQQILKRIQPIRDSLPPDAPLKEIAKKAFFERIDMTAHGFFALDSDRCGYDWNKDRPEGFPAELPDNSWKGHPFNYFTQGVAAAEVEIDVLTGDHKTISANVLVDVGSSINPAIDIGQIEGAFIQGMYCVLIAENDLFIQP
jgi:xanthine dehydrogenase/oxidase